VNFVFPPVERNRIVEADRFIAVKDDLEMNKLRASAIQLKRFDASETHPLLLNENIGPLFAVDSGYFSGPRDELSIERNCSWKFTNEEHRSALLVLEGHERLKRELAGIAQSDICQLGECAAVHSEPVQRNRKVQTTDGKRITKAGRVYAEFERFKDTLLGRLLTGTATEECH